MKVVKLKGGIRIKIGTKTGTVEDKKRHRYHDGHVSIVDICDQVKESGKSVHPKILHDVRTPVRRWSSRPRTVARAAHILQSPMFSRSQVIMVPVVPPLRSLAFGPVP
ncbi:hypothetical protein EVAR_71957_1 [Eumeta japonica]|uniref:Uncharacterized protein n=1 Tax=Eumeta variegata TaxID=151549 RepID=A0A4C1SWA9_EUMVA|nr:hypothetical protein EVAR_71957_1 [Eumeta japonica]